MSQTIVRFPTTHAPARRQHRLAAAWRWFRLALDTAATRRQLSEMSDRDLSDIGITRAQAQFELERPIWRLLPVSRR